LQPKKSQIPTSSGTGPQLHVAQTAQLHTLAKCFSNHLFSNSFVLLSSAASQSTMSKWHHQLSTVCSVSLVSTNAQMKLAIIFCLCCAPLVCIAFWNLICMSLLFHCRHCEGQLDCVRIIWQMACHNWFGDLLAILILVQTASFFFACLQQSSQLAFNGTILAKLHSWPRTWCCTQQVMILCHFPSLWTLSFLCGNTLFYSWTFLKRAFAHSWTFWKRDTICCSWTQRQFPLLVTAI